MSERSRKRIPTETELAVLDKSRRRCALCYQINGDLGEKRGQIAHLDKNPGNYAQDNLAFLCLDHHTQYDSKTSQHKNYTISELKTARNKLYEAIEQEQHLGEDSKVAVGFDDDRATLQSIVDAMGGGTMTFLKDFDFGNAFERDAIEGLKKVVLDQRHPEHEFIDSELEALRKILIEAGLNLMHLIGRYTFVLDNVKWSKVPDEWRETNPGRYHEVVDEMNSVANRVSSAYGALVRNARAKLAR
jgi:hypothetical protein